MAEIYYPFATGPGANANEAAWLNIFLGMGKPGVLIGEGTEFNVTGNGATVSVGTGKAHCFGHYYELDATSAPLTVNPNAGSVRYDRVVIRFDFLNDNAHVAVLQGSGTAAATMSFDRTGFYDLPLAVLVVPNPTNLSGAGTIVMAKDRWSLPMHWLPPGTMLPFASAELAIPKTALIPNGQNFKRFEYERLWDAWNVQGVTVTADRNYGRIISGSGTTPGNDQLKTPDMRGRAFFGLDTEGGGGDPARLDALDILGKTLGTNLIGAGAVPAHAHTLKLNNDGRLHIVYTWNGGGAQIIPTYVSGTAGQRVDHDTWDNIYANDGVTASTANSAAATDPDGNVPPGILGNWMMLV